MTFALLCLDQLESLTDAMGRSGFGWRPHGVGRLAPPVRFDCSEWSPRGLSLERMIETIKKKFLTK